MWLLTSCVIGAQVEEAISSALDPEVQESIAQELDVSLLAGIACTTCRGSQSCNFCNICSTESLASLTWLQTLEAEGSQVDENVEKGSLVEDATAGILSQLDALKSSLGLQ